jgi:SsrA-binding protein
MEKTLIKNKRATFDYELLEKFESGIILKGYEVKSLRLGQAHFASSYITISGGKVLLHHFHIAPYKKAALEAYDPEHERELLLHKAEILKISSALNTKGVTVIPLDCGLDKNRVKVTLAIAKGKTQYDKRESIKKRDLKRHIETSLRD